MKDQTHNSVASIDEAIANQIEKMELHEAETYIPSPRTNNGLPSTHAALEKAKTENLNIIYPKPNELQIDIDNAADYVLWQSHRGILDQYFEITKVVETPSQEKGHMHITVTVKKRRFNPFERIAFQAVLGSDRKRELLGLIMCMLAYEHSPTLFLEKKESE